MQAPESVLYFEGDMSMGTFLEEITLENSTDRGAADRGYISESQVRILKVEAMPDTGAWTLVINEEIRQKLGLTYTWPQ